MNGLAGYGLIMLLLLCGDELVHAQSTAEPSQALSSRLETLAERQNADPVDESDALYLERCRLHPLNLNTVTEEEFVELQLLTPLQRQNFFSYRQLFGDFLSIYELQAVPGWDLETIHAVLSFVEVLKDQSLESALRARWKGGDVSLMLRGAQTVERSKGYSAPSRVGGQYFEGSPQRASLRYNYNYKNILQYGLSGEKDPGEPFLRGAQRLGFDFYTFYGYLQHVGIIKTLAIGDFTINLGQGLTQWQSASFTKSSSVLLVKREAALIRPYHSTGEVNFHRGAAITLQHRSRELSLFISERKISSSAFTDSSQEDAFSSFQTSGYHRTPSEIANRNNMHQFMAGGDLTVRHGPLELSAHLLHFVFSRSFQSSDQLYHLFLFNGKSLTNAGLSYAYTIGNAHLFGELATDGEKHLALVSGALMSLSQTLDVAFLYRNISRAYASLYTDAFTENSSPVNEQGFYAALSWAVLPGSRIDCYFDVFRFPWLRYRVNAPSHGRDYLLQWSYQPVKYWSLLFRYKNEWKEGNAGGDDQIIKPLLSSEKKDVRIETSWQPGRHYSFKCRVETLWYAREATATGNGYLGSVNAGYSGGGTGGNIGALYFEAADYDTRVYTYESDMLYNFSLPAYYGKGFHYYLNVHRRLDHWLGLKQQHGPRITGWVRWSQTFYPGQTTVGTGIDQIRGNHVSAWKVQCIMEWR